MSPIFLSLLIVAVLLVLVAEWPRLSQFAIRRGPQAAVDRVKSKRRSIEDVAREESDAFARSVQNDLDSLPTISDEELRKML